MRHAAIILATNHRRQLLDYCLARLMRQELPDGWAYDVVVSGTAEDFGQAVARKHGAKWVSSTDELIGHKLRACVEAADKGGAELILWVGDDDLQPATRLGAAIKAHEAGARGSGVKGYWYLDTRSGRIAWWEGNRRWYGSGVALRTEIWRRIGQRVIPGAVGEEVRTEPNPEAWDIERAAEPWLYGSTWMHPGYIVPAHRSVGRGVVCLCHGRNLTSRDFPDKGKRGGPRGVVTMDGQIVGSTKPMVGAFDVVGMGTIDAPPAAFPDYPELRELCAATRLRPVEAVGVSP